MSRLSGGQSSGIHRINTVATALLRQRSLDDLLWTLAEQVGSALGLDDCVVYWREGDQLVQVAAYGPKNPQGRQIANPIVIPVGEGITGLVARTGISMLIRDTTEDALYVPDVVEGRSELAVPIIDQDAILGVIDSESPKVGAYDGTDRALMEQIADLASPRLAGALAEARQREALESRIRALEEAVRTV